MSFTIEIPTHASKCLYGNHIVRYIAYHFCIIMIIKSV